MKLKRITAILTGIIFTTAIHAQEDDFGSSLSFDVTKEITKGLTVFFEEEFRTYKNFSKPERFSHTLELIYKPVKHLKIGGAYDLMNFNHETEGWEIRHRYYFYATGMLDIGNIKLSLRERYQGTYRAGVKGTSDKANPEIFLRSRIEAKYNLSKSKFEPFVSIEMFNTLNDPQKNGFYRWRSFIGSKYFINKKNSLKLYHRYTHYINVKKGNQHIFGLGYSFSF